MKQTHLKTLSARIDELEQLRILNGLSFEEFTRLALDANKQSKTIVTLAHFVPCDANGVPLEGKKNRQCTQSQCIVHDACGNCSCSVDYQQELNEAQKSVIFEGWEVVRFDGEYLYIVNKESDIELEFNIQDGVVEVNLNQSTLCNLYGNVTTYADLAAATTENPLKLK